MEPALSDELTEKLIELVRDRPYLYDPRDPGHKDQHMTKNAWIVIGKAVGLTSAQAKKKWRNKREQFMKLRRDSKTKSGQAAKVVIRYKWSKQLQFLIPTLGEAATTSNVSDNEDDADNDDDEDDDDDDDDVDLPSDTGSVEAEVGMMSPPPASPASPVRRSCSATTSRPAAAPVKRKRSASAGLVRAPSPAPSSVAESLAETVPYSTSQSLSERKQLRKKKKTTPVVTDEPVGQAIIDYVKHRQTQGTQPQQPQKEDSDELFLRSCLEQLRVLPPKVKCEAKIEIMQLLYKKQYEQPPQPQPFNQPQPMMAQPPRQAAFTQSRLHPQQQGPLPQHGPAAEPQGLLGGPFMGLLSGERDEYYNL